MHAIDLLWRLPYLLVQACGAAGALFESRKASKQYLALVYGHISKEVSL